MQQAREKLNAGFRYHCDNLSGRRLQSWLNDQLDVLGLGGTVSTTLRRWRGRWAAVSGECSAEMEPMLEFLFVESDDTSVTLFGTTFTGPAGTTLYTPA